MDKMKGIKFNAEEVRGVLAARLLIKLKEEGLV
jgi:hypothetical protein